jgi:hypothetical protein
MAGLPRPHPVSRRGEPWIDITSPSLCSPQMFICRATATIVEVQEGRSQHTLNSQYINKQPSSSIFYTSTNVTFIMHLLLLFTSLLAPTLVQSSNTTTTTYLTAPALVTTPGNTTTIQCWRLLNPFTPSTITGIRGAQSVTVANVSNIDYTVLAPRFDGGVHRAPVPQ